MDELSSLEKIANNPAMLEKHLSQMLDVGVTIITTYGLKIAGAIIILIAGWTIAGMVRKAVIKAGERSQRVDVTVYRFAASVAKYVVLAMTLVATLASVGVETTSFVAVLGAAGLAIGLALQGTLSHVAAGLMLILLRPFRVGDFVEVAGITGTVTEISLFTTELSSLENIRQVIPNSMIWSGIIRNMTGNITRRSDIVVGISYEDNIDKAIAAARAELDAEKRVLKEPAPMVAVRELGDSSVNLLVRFWTSRDDFFDVQLALNKAIKERFDREGITIPFPQRVVHHIGVPASEKETSAE